MQSGDVLQYQLKSNHNCTQCGKELLLDQKVIRDADSWYHFDCFKDQRTEFDRLDEFEGPILKARLVSDGPHIRTYKTTTIQQAEFLQLEKPPFEKQGSHLEPQIELKEEQVRASIVKPKLQKCDFCKDEIVENESTISAKNKTYHDICFEFVVDKIRPQKQKRPKGKKSVPGRVDPVLIVLMAGIFGMLLLTAYLMLSFLSAIAISIGMALSFYHIIDAGRAFSKKRKPRQLPSYFVFVTLIMPIIFGAVIALDGYEVWYSAPKAIIVWGLALTFWSNMVFVPLSIYSKYKESAPYDNTFRPFVSVIVPAYNEEKVIGRTIESILAIDYPRKEIIVINDGSTDNTRFKFVQTKDQGS